MWSVSSLGVLVFALTLASCTKKPSNLRGEGSAIDNGKPPFAAQKLIVQELAPKGAASAKSTSLSIAIKGSKLERGTSLTVIFNNLCLSNRPKSVTPYLLDVLGVKAQPVADDEAHDIAEEVVLTQMWDVPQILAQANQDTCIVGLTNSSEVKFSGSTSTTAVFDYLNQIQADYAKQISDKLKDVKVKVAVLDTGLDLKNGAFPSRIISSDLAGTNAVDGNDDPQDDHGHGTGMTSIIAAHPQSDNAVVGMAYRNVEILPIRVANKEGKAKAFDVHNAVIQAINSGADVVNISLSANQKSCDPAIGHAIYRGIEKGVLFIVSAGNGIPDLNEVKVGFPLIPAKDDGAYSLETTASPACWGRYFKGVIAVGALSNRPDLLGRLSNYGDAVELSAPGMAVPVLGLNNQVVLSDGTSVAAAEVTAAAALVIGYHRQQEWRFSPWLIEDVLINGSRKNNSLASAERSILEGRVLNFKTLFDHLTYLESIDDNQRRRELSSNPRNGAGWDPNSDYDPVDRLLISSENSSPVQGSNVKLKSVLVFKNGALKDVTFDTYFTSSDSNVIQISSEGLAKVIGTKVLRQPTSYLIQGHYQGRKAVYSANLTLTVVPPVSGGIFTELKIQTVEPPVWGVANAQFKSIGKFIMPDASTQMREVTLLSEWSSDSTAEFKTTELPGVFNVIDGIAQKTYKVRALYQGKVAEIEVSLPGITITQFEIQNPLGSQVFLGQKLNLTANYVSQTGARRTLSANWTMNGTQIANAEPTISIDTASLALGEHTVVATSTYKSTGGSKTFSSTLKFRVSLEIDHLELVTKNAILNLNEKAQFDLRAYYKNNSYEVVTGKAQWVSSEPGLLPVDKTGVVYPESKAAGKAFTITANYQGLSASSSISIVSGSTVTGSSTKLKKLIVNPPPAAELKAFAVRSWNRFSVSALYEDGTVRDVSNAVSIVSDNQQELYCVGSECSADNVYGGKVYTLTAKYNDGNAAGGSATEKTTIVFPKKSASPVSIDYPRTITLGQSAWFVLKTASGNLESFASSSFPLVAARLPLRKQENNYLAETQSLPAGVYTVTASGTYRGMGYDENLVATATFTVLETTIVGIKIVDAPIGCKTPSGAIQHGAGTCFSAVLLLNNGDRIRPTDPITWSITDDRGNVVPNVGGLPVVDTFQQGIHSENIGDRYTVTVTHIKTGQKDSITFKTEGVNASSAIANQGVFPSFDPIPVPGNGTYCTPEKMGKLPLAGGSGTAQDPFTICSVDQLLAIPSISNPINWANPQTIFYRLMTNIDLAGVKFQEPLMPQGRFSFDGGGYEISNFNWIDGERSGVGLLTCDKQEYGYKVFVSNVGMRTPVVRGNSGVAALFTLGAGGCIAHFKNVYSVDGQVWGNDNVGAVVSVLNGTCDRCMNQGTKVSFQKRNAGGLIGVLYQGSISNSYSTGSVNVVGVSGNGEVAGGLVGLNYGRIQNSYAAGNVTGQSSLGGLVGNNYRAQVINSRATGNVTGQSSRIGGLVGKNEGLSGFDFAGLILNSQSSGTAVGATEIGGLVGYSTHAIIQECSSSSVVRGKNIVGGLVGNSYGYNRFIKGWFTGQVSGSEQGSARAIGGLVGLKSNYLKPGIQDWFGDCRWKQSVNPNINEIGLIDGGASNVKLPQVSRD